MNKKNIIPLIAIIAIIGVGLYFFFSRNTKTQQKTPRPDYTVSVTEDSVYVEGAYRYSAPFAITRFLKQSSGNTSTGVDVSAIDELLTNPRKVTIAFSEPINSYSVQATLHPSEQFDYMGAVEWIFTNTNERIVVHNGFLWDWKKEIQKLSDKEIKLRGETYVIPTIPEMLQGQDTTIHDTPFCFKDVDFDGEYELCFRSPGWNRWYFNVYKIVSPGQAELMTERPYNNIIYSDDEGSITVFDYDNQIIHMVEVYGMQYYDHYYKRKAVITNILAPLQHIEGVETSYGGGYNEDDVFTNGQWMKSEQVFHLDDSNYEIKADYERISDRTLAVKRLWYKCWFYEDGWQLLSSLE